MSMFKVFLLIAPLAVAGAASAQPAHLTDAQYIAAARCQALMSSSNLGRQDTRAIDALLRSESGARSVAAFDRAEQAREAAVQAARHAGPHAKAGLVDERDGLCRGLAGAGTRSASAAPGGGTRAD